MRRIAPAVALYFLAPFVAEFLLGDFPITMILLIFPLSFMYGGGALFIRELVRRTGRGWPTIILLALAFGVVEEGLLTQSLFNPDYLNAHLMDDGFVPSLGIAIPWTLFVLTIHTIWSISTPIAVVEESTRDRRTTPWLGLPGFIASGVLFVVGCAATFAFTYPETHFMASPAQIGVSVAVAAGLVVTAFLLPRRTAVRPGAVPSPWLVFGLALAAGVVIRIDRLFPAAVSVVLFLIVMAAGITLVLRWSARAGWGPWHRFALAVAAVLTYAWAAFFQKPVENSDATINLITHIVFAAVALLIIWYAQRRIRHREPSPVAPEPAPVA
jgi:hypothetical protein